MVNAGLIVIAFVCAGIGGWHCARSQHYKKKFKDLQGEYDNRCEELTNALGEVGRSKLTIESLRESNADLVERIGEYNHLMTSGCRNLKVRRGPSLNGATYVQVVGQDTMNPDLYFIVKSYMVDADIAEDREFAIREAEELIETIQKF